MINKVIIVLLFSFFVLTNISGQFQFQYTGPDSLFVDSNCEVALEWGHPNTPTVTSTIGANIDSFYIFSISDGYTMGQNVNAEQTITVTYRALDDQNNADFFSFNLDIVDTIPPTIITQPTDESYTCETNNDTITSKLHSWYNNNAGMIAHDNCNEVTYISDKSLSEVETEFNQSVNDNCGNTRSVSVKFTAKDQFDNFASDTFSAKFFTFDNSKPIYTTNPTSLDIVCNDDASDLLENWIDDKGGARASDNCSDSSSIIWKFNWSDNSGGGGYEKVGEKPYKLKAKTNCNYSATVYFIAEDECGNTHAYSSGIYYKSHDDSAPEFSSLPQDTIIDCADDIPIPDIQAFDDCKGELIVFFSDESNTQGNNPDSCDYYSYSIVQKWEADDNCGNLIQHFRKVTVIDTTAPSFDVPADIVVGCSEEDDLDITGYPQNIYDNCYDNLNIEFTDEKVGNACKYNILRTWTLEDACGNITTKVQNISVTDTINPTLVHEPSNITLSCDDNVLFEEAFKKWVDERGNAQITDNCNKVYSAAWIPGTYTPGNRSTYPGDQVFFDMPDTLLCSSDTILYYKDVDFVFYDRCFNTLSFTRRFAMVDIIKPTIQSCPSDISYILPEGECEKGISLEMPNVTDNCAGTNIEVKKHISKAITSDVQGSRSIPVNTVILEIGPISSGESNAVELLDLKLFFNKLDADEAQEYFVIYGENGVVIDTTDQTEFQCDSLTVNLKDKIPIDQFKSWILDGYLTITLVPNVPNGIGELAINDICDNGSTVTVDLLYTRENPNSLRYFLRVDDGDFNFVSNGANIDTVLDIGNHIIDFKVLDCGNNEAICTHSINIVDDQNPKITCPNDIQIDLPTDTCLIALSLPLNINISDNCESTFNHSITIPKNPENALIDFTFNSTLNKYVANSKVFAFENIDLNRLVLNPILNIEITGDIESADEYFEILSEDGTVIGNTSNANTNTLSGNCNVASVTEIKIDVTKINYWAQDGIITFTARPVINTNSINPCDETVVNNEGDNDGISKIFLTLEFDQIDLGYSIQGETVLDYTTYSENPIPNVIDFSSGISKVSYILSDASNNKDTCNFNVEVIDVQSPKAVCEEYYVLFVNPNGVSETKLNPLSVGSKSFDNCEIDSMFVFPNSFDCSNSGNTEDVKLFVWDKAGLVDSCEISIKIELESLKPSFKSGVCLNDSLKLFANLPDAPLGTWTVDWTGPLNFSSNLENPIRPNADATYSGTYGLKVTGLNGCESSGSVEVSIENLSQPILHSNKSKICFGEELLLETDSYSSTVKYFWFEGTYPIGSLVDSTTVPNLKIVPNSGEHYYYVVVKSANCESLASSSHIINVLDQPIANVNESFISLCEGEPFMLGTQSVGDLYHWYGPNGFDYNLQNPPSINQVSVADQGTYYLTISNGICSDTSKVQLVVLPKPMKPIIEGDTIYCEGNNIIFTINNITNADNYLWYLDDVFFKSETSNSFIIPDAISDYNGKWKVVVKSGNCFSDTSAVLEIKIEDAYDISATNSGPICEGDSLSLLAPSIADAEYSWSGPNGFQSNIQNPKIKITKSGEYQLVVSTDLSCEYYSSTYVEVKERPRITALSNDAASCISETECVKLFPSVFPNNIKFDYSWTGPNGFVSDDSIPEICDFDTINNGTYKLIISDGFCSSNLLETKINVNKKPENPIIGTTDNSICEGDSLKLIIENNNYSDDAIYHWQTPKDGVFKTKKPFFIIPKASSEKAGAFSVFVEQNGCISEFSEKIEIVVISRPNQPFISGPQSLCEGEKIELKLNSSYGPDAIYSWKGPNQFTSSDKNPVIFPATVSNSGAYSLTVIIDGCESVQSDGFFIEVIQHPEKPQIKPIDEAYCISEDISIPLCLKDIVANTSYSWYINNPTPILLKESNERCISIDDFSGFKDGENSIFVIATKDGCSSDDSEIVYFTINKAPNRIADAGDDVFVCDSNNVIIEANPDPNGKWNVVDQNTFLNDKTKAKTNVHNIVNGENLFVWSLTHGVCEDYSSDTTIVYLEYIPQSNDDEYETPYNTELDIEPLENDINIENTIINLEGLGDIHGKIENNEDGTFTYIPDPEFIGTIQLKYKVTKETCNENFDEGIIVIKVGDFDDCFGVNIITPNGDNVNDYLIFPCLETGKFSNSELIVFNQWGDQVYRATNYKNNWQGTYNNKDLPVGTYYYILHPDTSSSEVVKGFFVLER